MVKLANYVRRIVSNPHSETNLYSENKSARLKPRKMTLSLKVSPLENIRVGIQSTIGPGGIIDSSWNQKLCCDLNVYLKKIGAFIVAYGLCIVT